MTKNLPIIALLLCLVNTSWGQYRTDSLQYIDEVQIVAKQIFKKETAGMRETKVDTLILLQKSNLSLSELLAENTPVYIKSHGRGALATASFRGTAPSHTQVNWNGLNINNPMLGMVDFSLIPVHIIDDMNLKHGTSSIAEQSGGLGGSISIENHAQWDQKFQAKYIQGIGSFNTFDEFLQMGGGTKTVQLKTRLYHNFSQNNYKYLNRTIADVDPTTGKLIHPISTNENADFGKYGLLQEVYFRANSQNIISLKYWTQKADRSLPQVSSYEGSPTANINRQTETDHKLVADWKHYTNYGRLIVRSGLATKNQLYSLKNQVVGVGQVPAIYSISGYSAIQNSLDYSHKITKTLSLVGTLNFDHYDVASLDTVKKEGYNQTRNQLSALVGAHQNIGQHINLNLMLRQEWIDDMRTPFIPYFGMDVRPWTDLHLVFKGNIARNYHHPSLNDLYWKPGGNPNLLPEEGFSMELGANYQLIFAKHLMDFEATIYRNDIENWIIWIPTPKGYWEPQNIKRVLSRGVETNVNLSGNIKKIAYRIMANYAYTSSINYGDKQHWGDESYGKQLVFIPVHSGNLFVRADYKGFFITYQHNSYSERFATTSNDLSQRHWLYPYFMNDLSVGMSHQTKKLLYAAELKVYNLFNERYHTILYQPMPMRNYMATFSISF